MRNALFSALLFFIVAGAAAQPCSMSGTYKIGPGGDFETLTKAVDSLRKTGVGDSVILELKANYTDGTEVFPLKFSRIPCISAFRYLVVRPEAGAVGLSISSNNSTATINLDSARYIRFDGRPGGIGTARELLIANIHSSASAFRFINDASYNRLEFLKIEGRGTTTTTGSIVFLTTTQSFTNGNSYNVVSNCYIGSPLFVASNAIYAAGTLNKKNRFNTVANCEMVNSTYNGLVLNANNSDWDIVGNSVYQTNLQGSYGLNNGIFINDTTSFGFLITDNFIGGSAAKCTGPSNLFIGNIVGIRIYASAKGITSVQNNTVRNIRFKGTSDSHIFAGILIGNGKVHCGNITGNTIGSQTSYGDITITAGNQADINAGGIIAGPIDSYSVLDTVIIKNNTIGGFRGNHEGTARRTFLYGILIKDQTKGHVEIMNNTVGSPTVANSMHNINPSENPIVGIRSNGFGYAPKNVINNNLINNLSGQVTGISVDGGRPEIKGNTVSHLSADLTGRAVYGIVFSTTTAGTLVSENKLFSFTAKSSGSNTIVGIAASGIGTFKNVGCVISKNTIHTLQSTITNSGTILGMELYGDQYSVHNNLVRLGTDSTGAAITKNITFIGIRASLETGRIDHNSVFVGGSGSVESHALHVYDVTPGCRFMNNIFVNNRANTNPSTFPNYVIKFDGLQDTTGLTLDHNIYFTNAPGTFLGLWRNVRYSAIIPWRNALKIDTKSMFYNPNFVNPMGSETTGDLHLSSPTPAEGSGKLITTITDDFDGEIRSAFSPVDIGADAGNFVYQDGDAPILTHENFVGQTAPSTYVYNVKITDLGSGVDTSNNNKPRMWFRKKFPATSAWFSTAGNYISGNLFEGIWGFTPDIVGAGLSLNAGDSLQYYFVAQDKGITPNVGYSNTTGVLHSTVQSQTTAPTTPLRLLIYGTFPDTVYVGAGQTFTSLTNTNGFFHNTHKHSFNLDAQSIRVFITSDLVEDGTYGMATILPTQAPVIIGTNTPTVKSITSNGTIWRDMIVMENVENVTFDGSVNGNGRYLRFVSSGSSPSFTYSVFRALSRVHGLTINSCIFESNASNTNPAVLNFYADEVVRLRVTNNLVREIQGGPAGLPMVGISIFNNNKNDSIIIRNNEITNFGSIGVSLASTVSAFEINPRFYIDSNHFYYTTSLIQAGERTAMSISTGGGTAYVQDNFIGGTGKSCSGSPWTAKYSLKGIVLNGSDTHTSHINGNTIQNLRFTDLGAKFTGIHIGMGNSNVGTGKANLVGSTVIDSSIVTRDVSTGIFGYVNIFEPFSPLNRVENNIISGVLGDRFMGIDFQCRKGIFNNNTIFNNRAYEANGSIISGFTAMKIWMDSGRIEGNKIYRVYNNAGTGSSSYGLDVFALNALIARNKMYRLGSTSSAGNELAGIRLADGAYQVQNNQLDINNEGGNSVTKVYGLYITNSSNGGFQSRINYNTIRISGNTTGTIPSYAMYVDGGAPTRSFKNNLLYNERTSGTNKHLALGMVSLSTNPALWIGSGANNNLYVTADTAVVNEWKTNGNQNIRGWRSLSQGDSASFSVKVSDLPSATLFQSTATGDLNINNLAPECWYVNGKGIPIADIASDYDSSNIRSTNIATGPTDIGADEFNTTSTPPVLFVYGKHQLGGADTLSLNGRIIAIITWGSTGTLPTLGDCRWYSGQWPNDTTNNGTIGNARYMSSFLDIPATGGSGYTYSLTMFYDSSMLGKILNQGTMIINKKQTNVAGSWVRLIPSVVNTALKTITVNNQTGFSEFTATDIAAPLPIYLTSFTATVANKDVLVKWQVVPADEERFVVERSFDGSSFSGIATIIANAGTAGKYAITDAGIMASASGKTLYYRLKSTGKTGEVNYSQVVVIKTGANGSMSIKILPNPFTSHLAVQLNLEKAQPVSLTLYDASGKVAFATTRNVPEGLQNIALPEVSKLAAGIYNLVIRTNEQSVSTKLIKLD